MKKAVAYLLAAVLLAVCNRGGMLLFWAHPIRIFSSETPRDLFADDQGRLYVLTNEREGERKYWYDIFSREGAFIGRFPFDNVQVVFSRGERYYDESLNVVVKDDRLYCLREKDSGYMTLTAYNMKWK